MSSGYTPVFGTMLTGSLYGRWPHTGVWACLMSRVSRDGVIDEHPSALAASIGIPLADLKRCLDDFMAPDPESRSVENEGRRLELLDPARAWGWRVINCGKYREKARKRSYDEDRTASGADAARKRAERAPSATVPTRPDASRSHTHTDTQTQTEREDARARDCPDVSREIAAPDVHRGTIDYGTALTEVSCAEQAFAELENGWRIVGCDEPAMESWLAYLATLTPPKRLSHDSRLAAANLLRGMGDAATQQRAVQTAVANGWKSLRHGDGKASAGDATKTRDQRRQESNIAAGIAFLKRSSH